MWRSVPLGAALAGCSLGGGGGVASGRNQRLGVPPRIEQAMFDSMTEYGHQRSPSLGCGKPRMLATPRLFFTAFS
jgi:hypothetical protein